MASSGCAAAIPKEGGAVPSAVRQRVRAGAIERAVRSSGIGRRNLTGERLGLRVTQLDDDASAEAYLRAAIREEIARAGATVVEPDEASLILEVRMPVAGLDASGERGVFGWAICPFYCSEWIEGRAYLEYFLVRPVEGAFVGEGRGRGRASYERFEVFFWLLGPFAWEDSGMDVGP